VAEQHREHDTDLKDRVGRLMAFLRELVAARSTPVLRVERHQDHYWLGHALEFAQIDPLAAPGSVVLRAPRVTLDPPPELPADLHGWVSVTDRDDSSLNAPALHKTGPSLTDRSQRVEAAEEPAVQQLYEAWLPEWRAWAAVDRERRPHHDLFQFLVRMRQALSDNPESVEVVIASGFLELPASATDGEPVATHLLTQPVRVEQDPETGDFLCRFGEESTVGLEDSQLLTGHPAFDPSGTTYLRDRLAGAVTSVLDPEILGFLKEWAPRACTANVEVGDDSAVLPAPRLRPAPALVLRKRGAFALLEYYDRMIKASQREGEPVPLGIAQLVEAIEPEDRLAWLERTGATAAGDLALDPLFPLPANEEQRQIITRLGDDSGVVVEGPPGTGKTHTIANLMSSLLASGQRILVTSEKAQALRVLRDKLPAEMQELCVSITDVARGGSAELNRSVASLAARKAGFNPGAEDRQIADLASKRDQVKRRRASTLEAIRALRERETYQHPAVAEGYDGTAAAIARRVTGARARHDWVPLPVHGEPPLATEELAELLDLARSSSDERAARLDEQFPQADARPAPDVVTGLATRVEAGRDADAARHPQLAELVRHGRVDLLVLADSLRQVADSAASLRAMPQAWVVPFIDTVLSGRESYLLERAAGFGHHVDAAQTADRFIGLSRIEGLDGHGDDARRAFTDLADHLDRGGALKRVFKSDEQKAAEPWLGSVTVDGQPVTTGQQARRVQAHLDVFAQARDVAHLLSPVGVEVPTDGDRSALVGRLLQLRSAITTVDQLRQQVAQLAAVLGPGAARLDLSSVAAVEEVTAEATRLVASHEAREAQLELQRLAAELEASAGTTHPAPEVAMMVRALDEAQAAEYAEAHAALVAGEQQQGAHRRFVALLDRLRTSSPVLAERLLDTASDDWTPRLATWRDSWEWARAATWVEEQSDPQRDAVLNDELAQLDADLGHVTAQLAAARSWRAAMARMNAEQVQALQAYRDNLANVGMGTGKYAERYRQAARSAMTVAQGAVPAWVMPLQQVLASIPAQQNSFDVVIVDEASQADITSLFLLWLAPRVIVVGDDKQCTPSEVSAGALDKVFDRLDSYLGDVPIHLRATLTPRSSIFSMLRTRFGQVVRLREHFRCMPEIITWSSQMFYRDAPLVPVRQFGADRLPPLRTTFVEGGYTEGRYARLHNPVEAEAIVEQVEACLRDPAYDDKTLGVVVLQGQAQVDVIRNALLHRIPSEVLEERRLRIGTPPDFQGDERHVIFLSMVVGPEQRFATLTKNEYQRRFNVAASRAQDQLWLFHSVTPDRLSAADLRHSLLTYMRAAHQGSALPMPEGVTRDRRHPDFDSLFEQRVFLDLTERGYHVTPQVEVNSRRIDLVVTGRGSKLAVECDGDAWHTSAEQVQADLDRELELRRCGWTFWRVRESEYYLDTDRALGSLWETLDDLGIGPFQAEVADTAETAARWVAPSLPDDETPIDAEEVLEPVPATAADAPPPVSIASFGGESPALDRPSEPFVAPVAPDSLEMVERVERVREATGDDTGDGLPPAGSTSPQAPPYRRLAAEDESAHRQHVLQLAARGPISNGDVRDATGLDGTRARDLLVQLVAEGRLHRTGAKRGTRYHLVDGVQVPDLDLGPARDTDEPEPVHDEPVEDVDDDLDVGPADCVEKGLRRISSWLTGLSDRELDILRRRLLAEAPVTLEEIGMDYGVSRERIRQVEVKVRKAARALVDGPSAEPAVAAAVAELGRRLGAFAPVSRLTGGHRSGGDLTLPETALLWLGGWAIDGPILVRDGFELPDTGDLPLVDGGPEVDRTELESRLVAMGVLDELLDVAVESLDGVQLVDGSLMLWARSKVDQAVSVLASRGGPMSTDEIAEAIGGQVSMRSLRQRLFEDPRIVRTSRTHVGLATWGLPEYTSVVTLMQARLAEGSMSVHELAEALSDDFDVSTASVVLYSRAPVFVLKGAEIALRTAADGPFEPRDAVHTVAGLYRAGDDVMIWHRPVDADLLRGSGQALPMEIGTFIGVGPGGQRLLHTGVRDIPVTWPMTSHVGPQIGSLKLLVEARGGSAGDIVRVLFDRTRGELEMEVRPAAPAEEEPAELVARLTGLPPELCRTRTSLAASVSTSPGTLLDVLRRRGDTDVADAAARLPWKGPHD
jgi:very-short-patch-repair endonuclease